MVWCVVLAASIPASLAGAQLEVALITTGPGESVASRFGHAALWVRNPEDGSSSAFSFGQSGLDASPDVSLLIQGRLPAGGGRQDPQELLARYAAEGRSVWIQTLDLSPSQTRRLIGHLEQRIGLGPPYHFFTENCSTGLRDALDVALSGGVRAQTQGQSTGTTLRTLMSGFTATDIPLHTLTNLLLGDRGDAPLTRWDQMYLPATLRDGLRQIRRPDATGREVPLVRAEELRSGTLPNQQPQPRSPFMWVYLVAGVVLAGLFAALGSRAPDSAAARMGFSVVGGAWTLFSGILGVLMLALWVSSDPSLGQWNLNLLLASPLALPLGIVTWGRTGPGRKARVLAVALVASSLLALGLSLLGPLVLDGPVQSIAPFIALFLPAHLGLAWGIWRLSFAPPDGPA